MQYVDKVRAYKEHLPIGQAVDRAVDECIRENILREFLLRNKAEVRKVSIFEYDEEDTRRAMREYEHERGVIEGEAKAVLHLLRGKGEISIELQKEIMAEKNIDVLEDWLNFAAEAKSVDEFIKRK